MQTFPLLLRRPNAELAAAMKHTQQVQHTIIVTPSPGGDWRIPQRLDKQVAIIASDEGT
jgi:hypothetical protein